MKKSNTILILFGIFILCALGYSLYKWYNLKQRNDELHGELDRFSSMSESLNPFDCMVISGQAEAYHNCNLEDFKTRHSSGSGKILHRDYMLYCYILAIRDGNSSAATDFVAYYLNDIENNKIAVDTAVLKEAERLALQAINDSFNYVDPVDKFLLACKLSYIYEGQYNKDLADTLLYKQYRDSISKYAKLLR